MRQSAEAATRNRPERPRLPGALLPAGPQLPKIGTIHSRVPASGTCDTNWMLFNKLSTRVGRTVAR